MVDLDQILPPLPSDVMPYNATLVELTNTLVEMTSSAKDLTTPTKVTCPFGEIITIPDTDPPKQGIRGGLIYCGDYLWNVEPQVLNLKIYGDWLVFLRFPVEVNRDDDKSVLLPGVKTGTKPAGEWGKITYTPGRDYPSLTPPVISTGTGIMVVPLGRLTTSSPPPGSPSGADGTAVFDNTGCGDIVVRHCAGTISHTRE